MISRKMSDTVTITTVTTIVKRSSDVSKPEKSKAKKFTDVSKPEKSKVPKKPKLDSDVPKRSLQPKNLVPKPDLSAPKPRRPKTKDVTPEPKISAPPPRKKLETLAVRKTPSAKPISSSLDRTTVSVSRKKKEIGDKTIVVSETFVEKDGKKQKRSLTPSTKVKYGSKDCIQAVWEKAPIIPGIDPNHVRLCPESGLPIIRDERGSKISPWSWDIDHDKPRSKGGSDDLSNLQAMHAATNRSIGNKSRK